MRNLLLLATIATLAITAFSSPDGCNGTYNEQPLITDDPVLVAQVENGQKYTVDYDGRKLYVLVLNGTAYDMGFAYGSLMKEEIPLMYSAFFEWASYYIQNNVSSIITKLPKFLRNMVGEIGVDAAKKLLELNYWITQPYTDRRWNDEMSGLADATNMSVWNFRQVNLVPELLKASCSVLGAWGKATATGSVLHLRALDWEEHAPISRYPTLAVYHPTEAGSVPFTNIAWAGFIGSLTGHSSAQISIGERLGGLPDSDDSRFGKPWTYVLRDTLQFSKTIDDAMNYLKSSHRTCAIYLGIGSSVNNTFRIAEYSAKELKFFDDTNWMVDDNHPRLENVIWKAYLDGTPCFKNIVNEYYGNLTAEIIFRNISAQGWTGDSQICVMDHANEDIYVGYANPDSKEPAYVRPFVKVNITRFYDPAILEAKLEETQQTM